MCFHFSLFIKYKYALSSCLLYTPKGDNHVDINRVVPESWKLSTTHNVHFSLASIVIKMTVLISWVIPLPYE